MPTRRNPAVPPLPAPAALFEAGRTMAGLWPAVCLAAASPFFWAPPLWVLALMAPAGRTPEAAKGCDMARHPHRH